MNRTKIWRRTNSALLIIGVLVVALLLNALVGMLAGSLKIDLTREGYFSLSDTTRDLLGRVELPVEIAVLSEEESVDPRLSELFTLYEETGKTVTVRYVDPVKDPTFASTLPTDVANRLTTGSVWVTAEGRYRVLAPTDLIAYNELGELQSVNAEQRLTSAISYVVEPSDDTVTFVGGIATAHLVSLFENENYTVNFTDSLLVGSLDENTKALIYIMPQNDLLAEEIAVLEDFLTGGGRVAFFFGADTPTETPVLDDFLYKWNIRLDRNALYDLNNCVGQNPYYLLAQAEEELLVGANDGAIFMVPQAQSLSILDDQANNYVETEILATTHDTAMSEAGTGVMPLMASSQKYQGTEVAGKVLVSGSYMLLHDDITANSAYANDSFLNNTLRGFMDREDSVNIPQKISKTNTVNLPNITFWILTILVIIVIPAIIAVIGIVVTRKRRYL